MRIRLEPKMTFLRTFRLNDGQETIEVIRHCEDGSDKMLVSPALAASAGLKVTGKVTEIATGTLKVALNKGFNFSVFIYQLVKNSS